MRDEELRARFAELAGAAKASPPPDLSVIRGRARRRAWRIRIGGAVTVAVSCAVAALLVTVHVGAGLSRPAPVVRHTRHSAAPVVDGWRQAGPPIAPNAGPATAPYEVALGDQTVGFYRIRLGGARPRRIGGLPTPSLPATSGTQYGPVAVAGDDRTFVVQVSNGAPGSGATDDYYELQVGPGGLAAPLRLPVHTRARALALSADARQLAVADGNGPAGHIEVFSLPSAAHKSWALPRGDSVAALAWAGGHTLLALLSGPPSPTGADSGLYQLDTAATGGGAHLHLLISASTHVGQFSQIAPEASTGIAVAPAGGAVFVPMSTSGQAPSRQEAIVAFSLRTGQPLRTVTPPATIAGPGYTYCNVPWTDTSGQHLAVLCGTTHGLVDHGQFRHSLIWVKGFGGIYPAAW